MEKERPRRVLALDGGGLRGVATIAFLERLEQKLSVDAGRPIALHEHFDLIGGTSTGALIATALALNKPLAAIKHYYFNLAPGVFRRAWTAIPFVHSVFDSEKLRREILEIAGDRRMDSNDIRTGLAVVAKRVDTGSVWIFNNNKKGKFWDDPADGSYVGNRHYPLANVLRASTAAPHYFDPEELGIVPGEKAGTFIDGGVSPYNNPCLALFLLVTIPAYRYNWPIGADRLEITSIGTGSARYSVDRDSRLSRIASYFAVSTLRSALADSEQQTLMLMQALGRNVTPWWINSEIGDLSDTMIAGVPLFTFNRYNLMLENKWLKQELDEKVDWLELYRLRDIASPGSMQRLYELAKKAAERQIPVV
ncbi:patatin-like phospholipase family protein [Ensifer sp. NBAIM29]|nr:patatin-like phospholipase family protein [Ensifer sp. NBAIM29]